MLHVTCSSTFKTQKAVMGRLSTTSASVRGRRRARHGRSTRGTSYSLVWTSWRTPAAVSSSSLDLSDTYNTPFTQSKIIWTVIWISIRRSTRLHRTFIVQYNKAHHIVVHCSVIVTSQFT